PENECSISHDNIRSLYEDSEGVIWVGAVNGLNRYDPEKTCFTVYHHENQVVPPWHKKPAQEVSAICETADGQLLIGYWGNGAMLFDKKTNRFRDLIGF